MTSWTNQFDELKNQFVARSKERLVAIESLLTRLQHSPANVVLLGQIMQHFHWLAGSGGTYGFDDITSWGTYGEELCDYLLKIGGPVSVEDLEKLVTALKTVEQLFAAQPVAAPAKAQAVDVEDELVQTKMRSTMELLIPPETMNTIQDALGKSIADEASRGSGGYTPPPTVSSQINQGSSSGVYASADGQKASGAGLGGSLFSTASLSGSANKNQPATSASTNRQSSSNSYGRQTDSNPGANTQAGRPSGNPPAGNIPSDALTTTQLSRQAFSAQASEQTGMPGPQSAPPLSSGVFAGQSAKPGPAPSSEPRRSSRLAHIPIDKKFAIFADSNIGNLAPVKAALEARGISVEGVATASESKGLFAERLPDVFIVGAPLIDNNGYELVEYLRGLEAGHKPIVFVLAQQAVFLDKVYAIRAGADAFFEYPSELNDLLDKINALLDRDKNENYKVLSVEDDPDMANFIKLTLQSAGYTVLHISDARTFEEQFLAFEPDLVMLDVLLGEMTGFEIARYIRQHDRFATLPIVFLTTQNKLHQHIRSAIAGGDEHLIKPVAPQLLIATVASRLERARALKRLIDRDGLTRCLNFGSFMERAQKLALADGYRSAPAMMMIDVDNMKKINEKMGFAAGDRIISNIANMLLKGFRNTDLIARFGNDQFAIVLEHLNPQQLQSLSSQVLGAISGTPQLVKGRPVSVTCSGGVAVLEQGMSVQDWLDAAQDSLRRAKDAGGNRAIVKPVRRA